LKLNDLFNTDPAFANGMVVDDNLLDPPEKDWDSLFQTENNTKPIHGVLKVAGCSAGVVDDYLDKILDILKGHEEKTGESEPAPKIKTHRSRVEGWTRRGQNGKEQ
jgi:hypothetical protein